MWQSQIDINGHGQEIISKYLQGVSAKILARKYGYNVETLRSYLKKHRVKSPENYYGTLVNSDGERFDVTNIKQFALAHGLCEYATGRILRGTQGSSISKDGKKWRNIDEPEWSRRPVTDKIIELSARLNSKEIANRIKVRHDYVRKVLGLTQPRGSLSVRIRELAQTQLPARCIALQLGTSTAYVNKILGTTTTRKKS